MMILGLAGSFLATLFFFPNSYYIVNNGNIFIYTIVYLFLYALFTGLTIAVLYLAISRSPYSLNQEQQNSLTLLLLKVFPLINVFIAILMVYTIELTGLHIAHNETRVVLVLLTAYFTSAPFKKAVAYASKTD